MTLTERKQLILNCLREHPEESSRKIARRLNMLDADGYESDEFYEAMLAALDDIIAGYYHRHIVN